MNFEIQRFSSLSSTSVHARTHMGITVHDKSVILAELQTAGYGRRGTPWVSIKGNLLVTLVHEIPSPHPPLQTLSCVVGVAMVRTLLDIQPDLPLALKWPNDILLREKKVCGILIESDVLVEDSLALFIGIGLNVLTAPEISPPGSALNDFLRSPLTLEEILSRFLSVWGESYSLWCRQGFAPFKAFWTSRAYRLHEHISFEDKPGSITSGTFVSIDEQGGVMLNSLNNETRSFYSGRFLPY